jgi:hypothetical protein
MKKITRREALEFLIAGAIASFSAGYTKYGFGIENSNFRSIYLDPSKREEFFLFLENVFNLYPEGDFHRLIHQKTVRYGSDREIYQAILAELPGIKPALSDIRYALPSLKKQKEEMCRQTLILLDGLKTVDGYVEIGSPGRYISRLQKEITLLKKPLIIDSSEPKFRPSDIVERGQIRKLGNFISLNEYNPILTRDIPDESIQLLTVYIGFHHAPLEKRMSFLKSCYRILRKNGILIVRDHDVVSAEMKHFVGLAHDVFNAGLELPWETNSVEIRNFLTLHDLEKMLVEIGFQANEKKLIQKGDPTKNTLMKFVKI